ncbi:tudor domain-containing protein 15-like [Erpetoichthys calabaricus]|uniref:tudor domain-containing protein 15-like n=1 Tax=Erpetoichthys calabaricus TaxID=27687 RepID=UPI002233F160|nr:tudor domain-containing protein 15-like [Erpetoichthys calabaricus]
MYLNIRQKEACILLFVLRDGAVYANLIKNDNFSGLTPYIMEHLQKSCCVTVEDVRERLHYLGVPKTYGLCYRAKLNHITLTDKVTFFIISYDDTESNPLSKIKQLHSNLRSGPKEIILCDLKGGENLKEISEILTSHLKNFSSHPFETAFLSAFGDPVVQQVNIRVNEMSNILTQLAGAETKSTHCPLLRLFTPSYNLEKNLIPEPQYFFESVKTNGEYLGYAAEAAHPSEFYFHLEDSSEKTTTLYTMLQQLPEDLPSLPAKFIHQGVPCLIKCEIKGIWCRAVIKAIFSTFILVLLVDYGNKILVSEIGKLKQIPKLLVTVPCNVIPCLLKGVEPVNGMKWREEAVTFFQDCLFQRQLLLCFRQRTCKGVWEVDVRINDVEVAQMMIAAGQAVFVQSNFHQQLKPRQLHYPELEQEANENNILKQTCLAPSKKPQPQNKVPNCNII